MFSEAAVQILVIRFLQVEDEAAAAEPQQH